MVKFQRTKFRAYVKLGKGQKSRRRYRKAKGRHNKIREKRKSRPKRVEIGYKNKSSERGLIQGKKPIILNNIKDLGKIKKDNIGILGKIGNRKKLKIISEAEKSNIKLLNINTKKFKRKIERKRAYKEKIKKQTQEKKKSEEKKTKKAESKAEEKKQENKEEKKE